MKKQPEKIIIALFGIVVLLLGFVAWKLPGDAKKSFGGGGGWTPFEFTSVSTSSRMTVGPQESLRILATSTDSNAPNRRYVEIGNTAGGDIYLSINSDKPAVVGEGIYLKASTTYIIDEFNLYKGSIRAISASGVATNTVTITSN